LKHTKKKALILAIFLLVFGITGCSFRSNYSNTGAKPEYDFDIPYTDFIKVDENGGTELYVNPATMDIKLEKGEHVWESRSFTNESIDVTDTAYNSLFVVNASQISGERIILDSWVDCISKGQYNVQIADGKLTAKFTIGEMTTRYIIPEIMRQKQFEEQILNKLTESQRRKTELRYTLYTPETAEEDNMTEQFPALKKENMYMLNSDISDREKEMLAEYFAEVGFTEKDLDKEYNTIGYTEDDTDISPVFEIPLILYLKDGDLIAEIPSSEIRYDKELFVLNKLEVLKNLTATEKGEAKEIFLPDGSGAIIDLSKDSYRLGRISKKIYSSLGYVDNIYGSETASMPVFGLSRGNAALFAIIEDGDALAEVTADYSGSVKCAYPVFVHQECYTESVSDGWKYVEISNYNKELPDCCYKVRYQFLTEDTSYNGMAKSYRDYLKTAGILKNKADAALPFYLETLGSVNVNERVLLFPVNHEVALTTFEQDRLILEELAKNGINSAYLKLTGAVNGGMMNSINNTANICKTLGGKQDIKNLLHYAQNNGYKVFLNAEFTRVYKNKLFDSFQPSKNASKMLNDQYYSASTMNFATEKKVDESFSYCLSPSELKKTAERFLAKSQKLGFDSISAGAIGENIPENYADNHVVNRQQAETMVHEMLSALSDDQNMMISGANAYVFPYANHILNLPYSSSEYIDYAETVPFLQMVLHGHINYAVRALNITDDYNYSMLKAIETGSGIHFVLSAQNVTKLRSTAFSYYLATDREYWLPVAIDSYKKAASVIGDLSEQEIVGHYALDNNVYLTAYGNGKQVIVNYNKEAVTIGNITLDALGYKMVSLQPEELAAMTSKA